MTLPSKELLSAVLNSTVHFTNQIKCADNELCISFTNKRFSGTKNYNIYELAHKVKEWAWYDQSYQISSYFITLELKQGMSAEDLRQQPVCQSCIANINGTLIEYFDTNTEPEAIFKAGNYILENLKQ